MSTKRFFYVMIGGFVILIGLVIGGAVGGNTVLKKQSEKLVDLKTQNKIVEEQQLSLVQAKKDVEKYADLNKIAKTIVPQDKDQAKTIRELTKIAADNGIELKAINFQTSNLGTVVPKPAPTTNDKGASAAPVTPAQPTLSQVKAVDGIQGVYALEITISPADKQFVSYKSFLSFLEGLESNRRTAHVDKITVTPTDDGGVTFVLTLNAYVKP